MAYEYKYPKVEQPWKVPGYKDVDPATGFTYGQSHNREQYKEFGYDIGISNTSLSSGNFYANRPYIDSQVGIGVPRNTNPNSTIDSLIYEGWVQGQGEFQDAADAQLLIDLQAKFDADALAAQQAADAQAAADLVAYNEETARIEAENQAIVDQEAADVVAAQEAQAAADAQYELDVAAQAELDTAAQEAADLAAAQQIITDSAAAVDEEIAAGETQANLIGTDVPVVSEEDRQLRIRQVSAENLIDRQIGMERARAKVAGVDFNMSDDDRQSRIDQFLGGGQLVDDKVRNVDFSAARSAGMKPLKTLIEDLEDEDTLDIVSLLGST